jgi:hypothetical protein
MKEQKAYTDKRGGGLGLGVGVFLFLLCLRIYFPIYLLNNYPSFSSLSALQEIT